MTTRNPHYDTIVAWAEGKAIQWYDERAEKWEDRCNPMWHPLSKYRIKPEPSTAHQIYLDAAYPGTAPHSNKPLVESSERGFQAVINAVKSGELS